MTGMARGIYLIEEELVKTGLRLTGMLLGPVMPMVGYFACKCV